MRIYTSRQIQVLDKTRDKPKRYKIREKSVVQHYTSPKFLQMRRMLNYLESYLQLE